ncbi:heparinase II/III domain-containing protein [Adhaeribacter soli]|uniref:T9SS type A sorting domain-containing protein n=1 Tax=Adhaeribacter soli TaxID=2607655 RepID=A0A5N1IZW0_9BACT|nr:heparinase II/III family protein [Adhaeribacter soli]KAA9339985.1 T9SS type A sorting domain-containing protein [Adhaeribacter soli]
MPIAGFFTRFSFLFLSYTVLAFTALAQSGSWQPAGADVSFPRTLLKANALPEVRQSLQESARKEIYQSVYAWALATPPATNSTDTDRRLRARAAKNVAFIRIIGLNYNLDTLNSAQKNDLETKAISLLDNLNPAVEAFWSYEKWQWRSKELIDYLIAYDLLRGAGVPEARLLTAKTNLQNFAGRLYSNGSGFVGSINNNHLFMTAAALGMAGVVLNDMTSTTVANQPQSWINIGMYNIDNAMWRNAGRQSEPGVVAGYAEGPYYFKYAMQNCLPFFRAFGNFLPDGTYSFTWNNTTRQIRNPFFDPNYDLLYQWITDITLPDGRLPALEDSYIDMAMPELALTGKAQFVKEFHPQNLEANQLRTLDAQLDGTVDLRANYLAANVNPLPKPEKALTSYPEAGNLVFRSGNGFAGNYLHVYGKKGLALTNSGGHNHGDAGSFTLYSQGQLLALDAGYLNYNRRGEVGNATNHNLVLVDGAGPLIGTSSAANDAAATIQHPFQTSGLSYGEVATAYSGASITRKTLSVRGEYYLMTDFISAAAPHNFTWQLHGFGLENGTSAQGTFTDNAANHEGIWQKNGVSLKAHVTATNGVSSYTKTTGIHETTYNQAESHTTFLVNKANVSQTQFLAALLPYTSPALTATTLPLSNMAGLVTASAQFTDVAFTQADTIMQTVTAATLPETLRSDASFTFYSEDISGELAQVFLQNGTTLVYGSEQLLKSSRRANISWEQLSKGEFEGYVSKPATLLVKADKRPNLVTGQNLSSWTYDAATKTLIATFSQPSDFQLRFAQDPLPVELVAFKAEKVSSGVKLTWQTASEKNNRSFQIQRSADARSWKTIGEKAGQGTTSAATAYHYHDVPDFSGLVYYRLKQLDLSGDFSYSDVQAVQFEMETITALHLYPNPIKDRVTLELMSDVPENVEIELRNVAGQTAFKQKHLLAKGLNSLQLELAGLPRGFYFVTLKSNSRTWQTKFVKQ